MEQKKAFVTGASGLLGSRLVFDLFKNDHRIYALVRSESAIKKMAKSLKMYTNEPEAILNNITWIKGNVLDQQLLFDHITFDMDVYHCAAMVSFNPRISNKLFEINVTGTANVVNACVENNVRKLCHVSSIGALGSSVNGLKIDVDSPWTSAGKSDYSISKHDSEMEVWRGIAEGLNAIIVNPAVILGGGDWGSSSAALFARTYKGMMFYTTGTTGYVYVNDVSRAMLALMDSEFSNKRFILSAETLAYKSLFEKIARALNVNAPRKRASKFLTALVWRIENLRIKLTGGEPLISKYTHKTVHSKSDYNGEPITKAVNFEYTPIDKAIEEVAGFFRSQSAGFIA